MTCVRAYACGRVAYARDAFDGLHLMDKVTGNGFDDYLAAVQAKRVRQGAQHGAHAGPGGCARVPAGRCRRGAGTPPAADARRAGRRRRRSGARG